MSATNAATRQHAVTRINEFYDGKRKELMESLPKVPELRGAGTLYGNAADDLLGTLKKGGFHVGDGKYDRTIFRESDRVARAKAEGLRAAALKKVQPKLNAVERDRNSAIDRVFFWDRKELFEFLEGLE